MASALVDLQPLELPGVWTVASAPRGDHRGTFARLFDLAELTQVHGNRPIAQVNRSVTRQAGAVRGMHYQAAPVLEAKWVRCLRGRVFDVAVDLRRGSPTFLHHVTVELSETARNAIFIPEGFAHGFQALERDCELLYLHTAPYRPAAEGGVRPDDPRLGIAWPLAITDISERDRSHPPIDGGFQGLTA